MNKSVCITGASGFIGKSLCSRLDDRGYKVCSVVRDNPDKNGVIKGRNIYPIGPIEQFNSWEYLLTGIDVVIHCAARAHIINETESDPLKRYRDINVNVTKRLAECSAKKGVRRFLYLSSIGVNGINTNDRLAFSANDSPSPIQDYAISKYEAEQVLKEVSEKTDLEIVVIRPPLVYGPAVKGNFLRLLQLIDRGLPLPLGLINNMRSMIGLDNLVDMLIHCVNHHAAANQTFVVSDGEDLSTPELVRRISRMMGKSTILMPVPISLMRLIGQLTGKLSDVEQLVGSLQIDSHHTYDVLNWTPPLSLDEGLQKTVNWYMSQR